MPAARIRAARAPDLPAVLALWRAAEAVPSATDDLPALHALLQADAGALLVAERERQMVGTVVAAWDGWRASFYRLAVLEPWRRQGIGRLLVLAGRERLVGLGARRLTAFVDSDSQEALAFWAAAGFEPQRDRVRFVLNL